MSNLDLVYRAAERQAPDSSATTRRQFVAGTAATLGGLGLLATPGLAFGTGGKHKGGMGTNDPQTILNVAATAEVLATIVNTVGAEVVDLEPVVRLNVRAAALEELIHYKVLVSDQAGGQAITKRIWVPDAVFASPEGLLTTLEVGDQIFINAYLIAVQTYGTAGNGRLAAIAAEFMGAEAVHRALARQALGKLGNDRVFMRYNQDEEAKDAPNFGQAGFCDILEAVAQLQAAGFGFGAQGATPGRFYDFDEVRKRTPEVPAVNTRRPSACPEKFFS